MRKVTAIAVLALAGCGEPKATDVKVIAGAELPPIEHSMIVIESGKFKAVGTQAAIPVPKGAEMISGLGKIVEPVPNGNPIAQGQPANLQIRDKATGSIEMILHNGEFQK